METRRLRRFLVFAVQWLDFARLGGQSKSVPRFAVGFRPTDVDLDAEGVGQRGVGR
jgi:hypothetical protein